MDELRETGVEVIFVTVSAPKNSEDKILHGVRGLFAEYERAKITERFRLGKVRKVKEGHLLVSEASYGYRYVPMKDEIHGYYEINDVEAQIVKMIFMWVADEGYTLRKVVRKLLELGIKPRWSKRGVWSTSTLSTLLRNKVYIGEARWGSSYAVVPENPTNKEKYRKMKKSSRKIKPEEEWIASKIPVPAIVDRELFERARLQLETNFALCQRNKKNEYLLSGRIQCSCGRKRTGEGPMHGKHLYYRCTDRVLSFPLPASCKERGINARIADKLVWEKISRLVSSKELMDKALKKWTAKRSVKSQNPAADIDGMKKEINKLKEQEDRYAKAYSSNVFSLEKLREYTTPLREMIASIESQIAKASAASTQLNDAILPESCELMALADAAIAKNLSDLSFEEKRVIVTNAVDRIIGTQAELKVHGYIPVTNYVEFFTSDRNRRAT
ncbi:recombinase family protein [Candidatus Kaiserbacteria bacterium]|nr:recombinase family protein [Candidatus Kaiserbacteria bacterium]